MQGALIGFGKIAQAHLAAYSARADLRLKAIVDPLLIQPSEVGSLYNEIRVYDNFDEMIYNEEIDFVDICTPPNSHYEYIRSALLNHCHVLCEKPFVLCSDQYRGLLPMSKSVNKIMYPCHNYKFSPILRKIITRVRYEKFGQIVSGHFRTLRHGHAVGKSEWRPNWRRDSSISGGGILLDHGYHSIYIACGVCEGPPIAVSCIKGNLSKDEYENSEDSAIITVYFENNIQFTITLSWAANIRNTYYAFIGSVENIIVENDELLHTKRDGEIDRESIPAEFDDPLHKTWFKEMYSDFINVISAPDRQEDLFKEALTTSLIIEAAYLSASKGGSVITLPPMSEYLD